MADVDTIINNATALALGYATDVEVLSHDAYVAAQENALTWSNVDYTAVPDVETGTQGAELPVNTAGIDPSAIYNNYSTISDNLIALVIAQLAQYMSTYVLTDPSYEACQSIIDSHGSISDIANPKWNEAQVRNTVDNYNAQLNVTSQIAGRGMPMPPGALNALLATMALNTVHQSHQINLAATVENIKLQVAHYETALQISTNFKTQAMQALGTWIRAILTGPEIGVDYATSVASKQAELINAIANLYRSRLERDDLILKSTMGQNDLAVKWKSLEVQNIEDKVREKVNAAIGPLSPLSHIAAGALTQVQSFAGKTTTF